MPTIQFHEKSREFHLYNDQISYIITVLKNGQLGQLYFGKKLRDRESFQHMLELRPRGMAVCAFEGDRSFSMEHIRQEYPSYGTGDMRYPAVEILQKNGSRITNFVYQTHRITAGKPQLPGLPATYVEKEEEAQTLEITLRDELIQMDLVLSYTIFEKYPAIARNARFLASGEESCVLERAMSMSLDLPDKEFRMLELTGTWSRERHVTLRELTYGVQGIYSMRGCSSSNFNPFLALLRKHTTEAFGEAYGFSLVYSGNFLAQADVDNYDVTRVSMGIHPDRFEWKLEPGEAFQTPEAVLVYSDQGTNKLSQVYHSLYRSRLARGYWRDRVRPILINNWEATYFDFNQEKILRIAREARDLGIELFVLDDGWFGHRNDDRTSLGDWYVNQEKLPDGISGLSRLVNQEGLKFGLWFEPEMVSKDSDLFRAHPDFVLATPGRSMSPGRNQFVLDFSRPEVVDAIYRQMLEVLKNSKISYIKWDMNRCMSEVYSATALAGDQGKVMHRYILGVYHLYDRLTKEFPEILFESCASGGARFDPGMLYYAPQAWTSDDTDAAERCKIQYGTSFAYPISSMGAHVSAAPNHQLNRVTPLKMRADVAYFGTLGYELDLEKLTPEEKEEMKCQVAFMKQYRELIQFGTFYRLESPFEGNTMAWMVISQAKDQALVGWYRFLNVPHGPYRKLALQGMDSETRYRVTEIQKPDSGRNGCFYGDELMQAGLIVSDNSSGENQETYDGRNGDFQSRIFLLERC